VIKAAARPKDNIIHITIAALVLTGIAAFVFFHRSELNSLAEAIRSGRWYWLVIAAVAEWLYFINEAWCFSRAFRLTGTNASASSTVSVLLGAQALSVVMPSEFLADQGIFFVFARRLGKSPALMALGVSLAEMAELFSFVAVLIVGFLFLAAYGTIEPFEIAAGYIVMLLCLLIVAMLAMVFWKAQDVGRVLAVVQKLWGRMCQAVHSKQLRNDWAKIMDRKLAGGIEIARRNPRGLLSIVLIALLGHVIRIACLIAVIEAFGLSVAIWKVITAYAVGTLVWIASPIPGGIGLVEGAYSLVFVSLGVPASAAATLALAYRGIIFWLPLGAGTLALRLLPKLDFTSRPRMLPP